MVSSIFISLLRKQDFKRDFNKLITSRVTKNIKLLTQLDVHPSMGWMVDSQFKYACYLKQLRNQKK